MEILGIGPLELLFILLIALIILGPGDMVKAGKTLGRFLRKIITSPEWRTIQKATRELKYLPNRLMREASLEDLSKDFTDINKIGGQLSNEVKQVENGLSSWTTPPELKGNLLDEFTQDGSSSAISDTQIDSDPTNDNV
jgi:Sec-independent protein translocase protein TatA